MAESSHHFLSHLKSSLLKHSDRVFFRPYIKPRTWGVISYHQFYGHVVSATSVWKATLNERDVPAGSVIGCRLTGGRYDDAVNILGLCAAGYVPQLCSSLFSQSVIQELFSQSRAEVMVIDPTYKTSDESWKIPVLLALDVNQLPTWDYSGDDIFDNLPAVRPKDIAFIVHSSGTTGGVPKIIPQTHVWVSTFATFKWPLIEPAGENTPTVINTLGSLAHIGTLASFIGAATFGTTTLQARSMDLSPEEILDMIEFGGLNVGHFYAAFASKYIRVAQNDTKMLDALRGLRRLLHTGISLHDEQNTWARNEGIKLQEYYATTETSPLMTSLPGQALDDRFLRPIVGGWCQLLPFNGPKEEQYLRFVEAVVPGISPDAPHHSRIKEDGFYHTDDVFEKVHGTNGYVYRGRTGDWIKTNAGLIDTKAMEDAVKKACPEFVLDAVVIGAGQPYPVVVVEGTAAALNADASSKHAVAAEIVKRLQDYNTPRFPWDRVDAIERIIVVCSGELPRTGETGKIRRNGCEQQFKAVMDSIFA